MVVADRRLLIGRQAVERLVELVCARLVLGQRGQAHQRPGGVVLAVIGPHAVQAAVVHQVGFLKSALASDDVVARHQRRAARGDEAFRLRRRTFVGEHRRPREQSEAADRHGHKIHLSTLLTGSLVPMTGRPECWLRRCSPRLMWPPSDRFGAGSRAGNSSVIAGSGSDRLLPGVGGCLAGLHCRGGEDSRMMLSFVSRCVGGDDGSRGETGVMGFLVLVFRPMSCEWDRPRRLVRVRPACNCAPAVAMPECLRESGDPREPRRKMHFRRLRRAMARTAMP